MEEYECSICEKKEKESEIGEWRECEIGLVCTNCYPTYKKIRDKVKIYYIKSLKKRIINIFEVSLG
jgi:protein-arginine kinase activator protein McsA